MNRGRHGEASDDPVAGRATGAHRAVFPVCRSVAVGEVPRFRGSHGPWAPSRAVRNPAVVGLLLPGCGSRYRHRVGIPPGGRREVLGRVVGAALGVVVSAVSPARLPSAGVLVGLLAGLRPSLRASRKEPVDAPRSCASLPAGGDPRRPDGRLRHITVAVRRPGPGMKGHGPGARRSRGSCRAGPGHRRAAGRWVRGAVRGPRVPRPTRSARPRPAAPRGGPSCTAPRR
ncbi:hypothetical protein MBT84_32250 [Streptomyces sp. MBT84]|nr:hypothetical protein [Streptomyces sp. MBT84]